MMEEEQKGIQQHIAGDYHATSVYGDASLHVHPPTVSSVLPEWIWMVPYQRNPFFTGREGLLKGLHERFTRDWAEVLTGQAISGLGGIGKTQIVVEYAYRHREEYRFVLWASAASQETLRAAYMAMADRLQLPDRYEQEQDKIVAAVVHWLAIHEGWLLIIDNADEMGMVWPMLPTGSMGHLLMTTRDQIVGSMKSFVVGPMNRIEGTRLLLRRVKAGMELEQVAPEERDVAEQIVVEMDGLPLALDQVGAYIEEVACSLLDYLEAYRQRRSLFLADRGRLTSDHPSSVATTWVLSFDRVEQQSPAAADLLRVCAFLAPDAIPEELITRGARYLGPHLQQMEAEPSLLREMIRVLRAYSLIRRDVKEKTLSVHRLVQAVLQDTLEKAEQCIWTERTLLAVNAAFPDVEPSTRTQCKRLLPQALAATQIIAQYQLISEEAGRLLYKTASYFHNRAHYFEAEPLYQRALRIKTQTLGPEHPDVVSSLNGLLKLYHDQSMHAQAEAPYPGALHINARYMKPEHPDVASLLNNQTTLHNRTHSVEADLHSLREQIHARALRFQVQFLGPEHPKAVSSLNELVDFYHEQGKYAEAEPLYQRAFRIVEQQLGPEHPGVAYPLNSLAHLYSEQGRYAEAEMLYQRAFRIVEQQLGPEHPLVGHLLLGRAHLYSEQGKYAEAEQLYQRALHIVEQALGPEHPGVAYPLNNLATFYHEQGKYAEAEPLYQRALHIVEQQLGPEHPDTVEVMHNLARLQEAQGNSEDARVWYARALAVREQALEENHYETTEKSRELLIALLHNWEQLEKAAQRKAAQSDL